MYLSCTGMRSLQVVMEHNSAVRWYGRGEAPEQSLAELDMHSALQFGASSTCWCSCLLSLECAPVCWSVCPKLGQMPMSQLAACVGCYIYSAR